MLDNNAGDSDGSSWQACTDHSRNSAGRHALPETVTDYARTSESKWSLISRTKCLLWKFLEILNLLLVSVNIDVESY